MQDIKLIRENPEKLIENIKRRKNPDLIKKVEEIKELDEKWRSIKHEEDKLRSERNRLSKQISELKKKGENTEKILQAVKDTPAKIQEKQNERILIETKIDDLLKAIPNMMHESVPYGKDDTENVEIKKWGDTQPKNFDIKSHKELIEDLGIADFTRSAKISGAGYYILRGDLALLNQALIRFAIDQMIGKGFEYTEVPYMMKKEAYQTGVSIEDFEEVMYKVEGEDSYLIATSEHPLLGQYMGEKIEEDELPIKMTGYSMCFRKEVGSSGIDTKGLFRTHQFNKIEMAAICKPEDSWNMHEEFQKIAESIMQKLELPYRVVNICTGDLGNFASKKYDIEAWMPKQKEYKEVGSNSNFTDYQTRRANIKYHKKDTNEFIHPHTLNNTAIATSRIMVAIIENYQTANNTITIPKVLRPYMYGKETITNNIIKKHV